MAKQKMSFRDFALALAAKEADRRRVNRVKNANRNEAKGRKAAEAKLAAKEAARAAKIVRWEEWRPLREFARRQAKRGLYIIEPETVGYGTRGCVLCGCRRAAATAYTLDPQMEMCNGCQPQYSAVSAAFAAHRAARARARQPVAAQLGWLKPPPQNAQTATP